MTGHRESTYDNTKEYREMEKALADRPPVITWELRGGIRVPVDVDDPHAETQYKPKGGAA